MTPHARGHPDDKLRGMFAAPALGIDFGTSHTTAALRRTDGRVEGLVFDGSPLLPSAVYAEDVAILVGRDACDSARLDPSRFEPNPKRRVDDGAVLLGDREIPVGDLFAAVLAEVRAESERVLGSVPRSVRLTHPATWGPTRRLVLQEAARSAGFPTAAMVPEPVAAATYYVAELGHRVPIGSAVVVHDFGGGTFDAGILRRSPTGFEVLAVDGLDDLGGVDIDGAIVEHLRGRIGDEDRWRRLLAPADAAQRRQWRTFHDDVRQAKERLSRQSSADLFVPIIDREIHLTRAELEDLARPMLRRAATVVKAVVRASGLSDAEVTGIFLVGGASRMPLVSTVLHQETGMRPTAIDRLELVVAHGALLSAPAPPETRSAPAPGYRPVPPDPPTAAPTGNEPGGPKSPGRGRMPFRLWIVGILMATQAALWLLVGWFADGPERALAFTAVSLGACLPLLRIRRIWALGLVVGVQLASIGAYVYLIWPAR